jgi:acyl-coenzyme A thioesterase PaaI-like protein
MTFAVLTRPDTNLNVDQEDHVSRVSFGIEEWRFAKGFHEQVELTVVDAGAGVTELPLRDYVRNSMGAVQGGIVAAGADAAAEHAIAEACGGPVEVVDLQISYLALVKAGPMRTTATVLDAQPEFGRARVEIVDTSADGRLTTVARVVAVRP